MTFSAKKYLFMIIGAMLGPGGLASAQSLEHTHPHPGPASHAVQRAGELLQQIETGLVVEMEGFAGRSDGVNESDFTLATLELVADLALTNGIALHLGLLWEEDDREENLLDEAFAVFGATEEWPVYAVAGKFYLPFGRFDSSFISDPLTLELGEINESAVSAGYRKHGIDLSIGAFNGDLEADTDEDTIDNLFAAATVSLGEGWEVGTFWLSDLLETDGLESFAEGAFPGGAGYDEIDAAGCFLCGEIGPLTVTAEYISALDAIALPAGSIRPQAYNVELSMPLCEKTTVGLQYGGSDEFYADYGATPADAFPDWRTGMVVSYQLNPFIVLSGEYLHGEVLDADASIDTVTVQMALLL